ncbi:MAG TPA: hypothetical protein VK993_10230 [Chthoniobacterales bacterium]|nr:hypothetical protein [Chthoniobacterales bacterium]
MRFLSSLALLAALFFTSCEIDEPPRRTTQRAVTRPAPVTQYPPPTQPFEQDPSAPATTMTPPIDPADTTAAAMTPPTTATTTTTQAARGDYPYGVPVPDKPGFVRSPYSPDKLTDVRGYAPGTEVKDPYTGKIFLVP